MVYKMENICMKSCFYGIIKLIKKEVENNIRNGCKTDEKIIINQYLSGNVSKKGIWIKM